jgi:S-adenosylmethionine:tRNA ribosyltransferase-isomerase
MTSGYDYSFPKELIAQHPAKPRDAARLLVYSRKTKKIGLDTFRNLPKYLPPRSLLVLNDTKVIPARLSVKKESGGSIKLLYVGRKKETLFFLSPQTLKMETRLCFKKFQLTVLKKEGSVYSMRPSFPASQILPLLERFGEVPLPPYIKNANPQSRKIRQDYQAIFARHTGSVAAPTASLHFTKRLLSDLRRRGHKIIFVTLHVNLGTFAPVTREQIKKRKLHEEEYSISEKSVRELVSAKKERRSVIALMPPNANCHTE